MSAAKKLNLISAKDYLAGELDSPIKHEYVGGDVYTRAGARNLHNLIASNILGTLGSRLRGKGCRAWNSDTKVRIHMPNHLRFYYPDASVVCRPNPRDDSFHDEPVVIVEVLSHKTRRIDEGEKKDAYLSIPSLGAYLLVEQEFAAVVAYRRTVEGFVREVHEGLAAVVPLPEIETDLPLTDIYEAVDFIPEPADEEGTERQVS